VMFGASGCASGSGALAGGPDVEVRKLAQQRWDALVAGDIEKAYGFLSPGTRQARSLTSYRALIRVGFWQSAQVDQVECPSADVCKVVVMVEYVFRGSLVRSPLSESWVYREGRWWAVSG